MMYKLKFHKLAAKELEKLSGNQKQAVAKALNKIINNPKSIYEGGYGKPLRNNKYSKLAGYLKVKIKNEGIRIVYKVIESEIVVLY